MRLPEPAVLFREKVGALRYLDISLQQLQWFIANRIPFLSSRIYEFCVTERILEYPFVHSNLELEPGGRILDVGTGDSTLPIALASQGYQVWAIDLDGYPYPVKHPNFTFVQGNICKTLFSDNFFDRVVAVSSIEHIGLGGVDNDFDGDKKALKEIARILKFGGKVIITVPFGKKTIYYHRGIAPWRKYAWRVYDSLALKELLSGLEIEKMEHAISRREYWFPASVKEAENADWARVKWGGAGGAVAMVVASK